MSKAVRGGSAAVLAMLLVLAAASPSFAATASGDQDQVVLSGSVLVPPGRSVGEVIVVSGKAVIGGVARGDVVVLDGPISVTGQVSGTVVALGGAVRIGPNAQIGGDVLAHDRVFLDEGAQVSGNVRERVRFTLEGPLRALGIFLTWLAVALSTLILGALLLLLVPRGADRIAVAARTAPLASLGWGVLLAIGVPVLAVLALVSVAGIPLGLAVLLALGFLYLLSFTWGVWVVGRLLIREPRSRWLALLAGWGIALVIGAIPWVSGIVTGLGAVFGLGAMTVAMWRARGPGRVGRHRVGRVPSVETEELESPAGDEPAPEPGATVTGS